MEIPAEPSTTAIFKALMSKGTDPQLAFDAVEEIRQLVGCPVIEAKGARVDVFGGPGLNPKTRTEPGLWLPLGSPGAQVRGGGGGGIY